MKMFLAGSALTIIVAVVVVFSMGMITVNPDEVNLDDKTWRIKFYALCLAHQSKETCIDNYKFYRTVYMSHRLAD